MTDSRVEEQALVWAIRTSDPDFDDWQTFTAWLEVDPLHHEQYDRASTDLAEARELVAATPIQGLPEAANDQGSTRRTHLRWGGGAIAAALVGVVTLSVWQGGSQPYAVQTAPGQQRSVQLADGSSIVLAGGSRVMLDHDDIRTATVVRGEVLFQIRHDAARPFQVTAGDLAMTDLGTVFDVKLNEGEARVAVSEGAVMIEPKGARVRLDPGQAIVAEGGTLRREPGDDVGGWREGRLAFSRADLADVAGDLGRHLGRDVRANRAVADRPFSGTVDVATIKDDPEHLGLLLGVRVRVDGNAWTLESDR